MKTKASRTRTKARQKRSAKPLEKLATIAEKEFAKVLLNTQPAAETNTSPASKPDDVPELVATVVSGAPPPSSTSYEEANWAKLSPMFRNAHNRLRKARGQQPIPEPKIDLWVPPALRKTEKFDPSSREFMASAREFLGPGALMGGGHQGFEDRGSFKADCCCPSV